MDEEILRKGSAQVKARVSGVWQSHRLTLRKERHGNHEIYVLAPDIDTIPPMELVRVANELKFPVRSKNGFVVPTGMRIDEFKVPGA